ncbi:MAG: M48 family metallopeptidase [Ferruginibacter sp.]
MPATQSLYPESPANIPASVTAASATFKKEVRKVLFSIFLFFTVYILLVVLSILLAIACMYAGFFVIANSGHLLAIIAGLGIVSIGVMVFVFLIKFIFSVKKHDESGTIQLSEQEHPQLFAFIRQLTIDTQTRFPKKIVLSPEVNACVYYNDSFWSMIFPVRKNLQIGLALVNTLTLSEFKAVMAHEFGHFSQRSMKLGSFVYNVNKAIYNMLFENKDLGSFLEKWGSFHWAVGIFVWVTIQLIKGIQLILRGMYSFINKNYMSLSREMEFHADAVSASVSGSGNCISALRKLEIGDVCYQTVIQKANDWLEDNVRMENVYRSHDEVMLNYAEHNNLPVENSTPVADMGFFRKFQLHKVNVKDQWASHPPREEREEHLLGLNVVSAKDSRPAWVIFTDAEKLQARMTEQLYSNIPDYQQKEPLSAAAFRERYLGDIQAYHFPDEYNGYFDNHPLSEMNTEEVFARPADKSLSLSSLFTESWIASLKSLSGNEYDRNLLKSIVDKEIVVRSFDYDGEKMERDAAPALLQKIEDNIALQTKQLQEHDERIVSFFYQCALNRGTEQATALKEKYTAHFNTQKSITGFISIGQRILECLAPLLAGQTIEIARAESMADDLRLEGGNIKPFIREWLDKGIYNKNRELRERAENFLSADYQYFHNPSFKNNELGTIHLLVTSSVPLMNDFHYRQFKSLLEYQLCLCTQ